MRVNLCKPGCIIIKGFCPEIKTFLKFKSATKEDRSQF